MVPEWSRPNWLNQHRQNFLKKAILSFRRRFPKSILRALLLCTGSNHDYPICVVCRSLRRIFSHWLLPKRVIARSNHLNCDHYLRPIHLYDVCGKGVKRSSADYILLFLLKNFYFQLRTQLLAIWLHDCLHRSRGFLHACYCRKAFPLRCELLNSRPELDFKKEITQVLRPFKLLWIRASSAHYCIDCCGCMHCHICAKGCKNIALGSYLQSSWDNHFFNKMCLWCNPCRINRNEPEPCIQNIHSHSQTCER